MPTLTERLFWWGAKQKMPKHLEDMRDACREAADRIAELEKQLAAPPPENQSTVTEAAKRYLAAIDSEPENDIWDTWNGKPADGAPRMASDASWADHGQTIEARLSELRAALATEGQP